MPVMFRMEGAMVFSRIGQSPLIPHADLLEMLRRKINRSYSKLARCGPSLMQSARSTQDRDCQQGFVRFARVMPRTCDQQGWGNGWLICGALSVEDAGISQNSLARRSALRHLCI